MTIEFKIPKPRSILPVCMPDGAEIIIRRHGNLDGPRIIFSHGNGFASDAYFPFWQHFLSGFDLIIYDQRNHGWNPRHPNIVHHDVPWFSSDLEEIIDQVEVKFGKKPTSGVFHSISAITSIRHALEFEWRWKALILFDPPFVMPPNHDLHDLSQSFELMLAGWSAERTEFFSHPEILAQEFKAAKSLSRLVDGAHELMARSILKKDKGDEQWSLCCPPAGESRVYATNGSMNLTPHLKDAGGPLKVIASDPDDSNVRSPGLVNRALSRLYDLDWQPIPGTTHMLQLEKPAECAAAAKEFLLQT